MNPSLVSAPVPRLVSDSILRRILAPSFSDCLFISLIAWLFMSGGDGWSRLLLDGDCGWHIRTGDFILDHGIVPRRDLFSFSRPADPWFAWEWGADVLYALLHRAWGLKGIVIFAGAQIALLSTILLRYMIWRGANTLIAIALALLVMGASSMHFLARPHLFTLTLVPLTVWILERDRQRGDRWVWLLIPLTAVWTNLHGGFLAGIACMGLYTIGITVETWWNRKPWSTPLRPALLTALCSAATLANPYGYHLHSHIAGYLTSDWIREAVQEFQSPSFRSENLFQYELLLIAGLMAAALAIRRRSVVEPLLILFWAHQSLASVRHATVFAAVAAPVIAVEATRLWQTWVEGANRRSVRSILDAMARDMAANFGWSSVWPAAFLATLFLWDDICRWPRDFPDLRFPTQIVSRHQDLLARGRVLATDQWADYLIYRSYPLQRVFFDGRSDFYGPSLGKQYIRVSGGGHDWRKILDEHRIDAALIPSDWALGSLLKQAADWRLIEDDGKTLLFVKDSGPLRAEVLKKAPSALMKSTQASEIRNRDLSHMKPSIKREKPPSQAVMTGKDGGPRAGAEACWRLPSGQLLAEFALRGGFVAPGLLKRAHGPVQHGRKTSRLLKETPA